MFFAKCKIRRIKNNRQWQVTTLNGRVIGSSKVWRKAFNMMTQEQRKAIAYWGRKNENHS